MSCINCILQIETKRPHKWHTEDADRSPSYSSRGNYEDECSVSVGTVRFASHDKITDGHHRERLMVKLRYLATGSSMASLNYDWCISVASLSNIIPKACEAVYNVLKMNIWRPPPLYWGTMDGNIPKSRQLELSKCYRALHGMHIVLTKPWHAGSENHNYKG